MNNYPNISLDCEQQKIFSEIDNSLKENSFLDLFKKKTKGFYIFGNIGSGKTHLLKTLYHHIQGKKIFYHYHNFLLFIHELLKKTTYEQSENKIDQLVNFFKKNYEYIFIDELEILDITDAMLMKELIPRLGKYSIKIFFSTNIAPQKLYHEGIQRQSFLPFIEYIKQNFLIKELNSPTDYRLNFNSNKLTNRYLFPNNKENNSKLINLFFSFTQKDNISKSLTINNHNFNFKYVGSNAIVIEFEDFFNNYSSIKDFEFITNKFNTIFILNIRPILAEENNIIKRFINFIDLAYLEKNILFITCQDKIEKIYISGRYIKEFQRTLSRLTEMQHFED